ncbi:MAG: hypothetical protein HYS08_04850 [Chlamydiae bacterium]|nr:hypothetical protein [Chlamydiota bacterium]MBI3265782.1 hypothetical protein [Chlamydiota bacterium]
MSTKVLKGLRYLWLIVSLIGFQFCCEAQASNVDENSLSSFLSVVSQPVGNKEVGRFQAFIQTIFHIDEQIRKFQALSLDDQEKTAEELLEGASGQDERLRGFLKLASLEDVSVKDIAGYVIASYSDFNSFKTLDLGELTLFVGSSKLVNVK